MQVEKALVVDDFDCHWWLELLVVAIVIPIMLSIALQHVHEMYDLL